jgi:putative ABC transport system permease protein
MDRMTTMLGEFLRDLRAQKLRTALTVFGIVWGTVAIVVLLSFGMGFRRQLTVNMHGIGESVAIMFPGRTTRAWQGFGTGRGMRFVAEDVRLIATQVRGIAAISPEYGTSSYPVRVGDNIINAAVSGVEPVYADMRNVIPEPGGRFVNDPDLRQRRRVALIGDEVKRLLFAETEAVGRIIHVGDVPFTVVGVMKKKTQNSSYNRRDQDRVFIPASTFASVFGQPYLTNIIYRPADPRRSEDVQQAVRAVLAKRYRFDPEDVDAVWIWDTSEFDKFLFVFFLAFNIFLGVIGAFTLCVGGIGVANIMYIVVQERTREIGIRRAVGATRGGITFQFFMETLLIIGLGSAAGMLIALGVLAGLRSIPIKEFVGVPEFSWEVAAATALVLATVALAAGLLPARRAAGLNVVDCLRG